MPTMKTDGKVFLDFETYSGTDITCGVYKYVEDPDFLPLMVDVAVEDCEVTHFEDLYGMTEELQDLWSEGYTFVAHNANFERVVMSQMFGLPVGQYLDPDRFIDTAMLAAENGYPRALGRLAKKLGGEVKDEAGKALIRKFCQPNRKGERTLPGEDPEQWKNFGAYCTQDVATLRDVAKRLPDCTPREYELWVADQLINDRGIAVDLELARKAEAAGELNIARGKERMKEITGLENPGSTQQLLGWLRERGEQISRGSHGELVGGPQGTLGALLKSAPDARKETVKELLQEENLPDDVRMALRLRQATALVAHKKYTTILACANSDGRLRGQFRFFGAHTGRWTGSGVQMQNLARPAHEQDVIDALIVDHENGFWSIHDTDVPSNAHLKSLVRSAFLGPLDVTDYSAIEARVLAWLAGEEWALQAFREHRDLYVETAARMGPQYTRKEGKVAVLALGYNGAVGSLAAFGFGTDGEAGEQEALNIVLAWREANRHIVRMWAELEEAFSKGDPDIQVGAGKLRVRKGGDRGQDRHIILPSGRELVYHNVRMLTVLKTRIKKRRQEMPDGSVLFIPYEEKYKAKQLAFDDPTSFTNAPGYTYGGRLTENITQAVARDLLGEALINLENEGFRVVGHVHDEVLIELGDTWKWADNSGGGSGVRSGYTNIGKPKSASDLTGSSLLTVNRIMTRLPSWADGLPHAAAGFETIRYQKEAGDGAPRTKIADDGRLTVSRED